MDHGWVWNGCTRRDVLVPRTRTELDRRSFRVAAPSGTLLRRTLLSPPADLRSTLISRRQFRDGLKSHLFATVYFWSSENIRYKGVMYLLITYQNRWPWITLNGVMAIIVRYFAQLSSFRGQLRKSGWLNINRLSSKKFHKVHHLSMTDALCCSR